MSGNFERQQRLRDKLEKALAMDFPYSEGVRRSYIKAPVSQLIPAAVLILFGMEGSSKGEEIQGSETQSLETQSNDTKILYIQRTETVETHKGQISFPGGMSDAEDQGDFVGTALRETWEEVGIHSDEIQVLGSLPPLSTHTGFRVHPIVGVLRRPLESIELRLSQSEVAEVFWAPLDVMTDPKTYRTETYRSEYQIDVFRVNEHRIWGITGTISKNLLDRLKSLG